jgi:hypothetical protein
MGGGRMGGSLLLCNKVGKMVALAESSAVVFLWMCLVVPARARRRFRNVCCYR